MNWESIEWLILDVDGVLTDGRLYFTPGGEEIKVFDVKDGLGLTKVMSVGVKVAVISGRECSALRIRLAEFAISECLLSRPDKDIAFDELASRNNIDRDAVACIGDDLPDLLLFDKCKFKVAVNDAVQEVRERADLVLKSNGGQGAVREFCDFLVRIKSGRQCYGDREARAPGLRS